MKKNKNEKFRSREDIELDRLNKKLNILIAIGIGLVCMVMAIPISKNEEN